jgi:hypothetical protein
MLNKKKLEPRQVNVAEKSPKNTVKMVSGEPIKPQKKKYLHYDSPYDEV